jgi:hypothetical protein
MGAFTLWYMGLMAVLAIAWNPASLCFTVIPLLFLLILLGQ